MTLYLRDVYPSARGETIYNVFCDEPMLFADAIGLWAKDAGLSMTCFNCHQAYLVGGTMRQLGMKCGGSLSFNDPNAEMLFKLSTAQLPY